MQPKAARFPNPVLTLALAGVMLALAVSLPPGAGQAAPEDKVIAAGRLKLAGRTMSCRGTPTLLSYTFWDYAGADKDNRRIILNPKKLEGLPEAVRLYVYAHECGHHIYGTRETRADCYAVQRGVREGWLDRHGMDQVCEFIVPHAPDWVHPPGPKRCRLMRACFDKAKPPSARR
jgi:hypothetical protein